MGPKSDSRVARNNPEFWLGELQVLVKTLLAAPVRIDSVLGKFERGEIAVHTPDISSQAARIELAIRQASLGIVFAAFLLAGVQVLLAGMLYPGIAFFVGAGLCLIWMIRLGRKKI